MIQAAAVSGWLNDKLLVQIYRNLLADLLYFWDFLTQ